MNERIKELSKCAGINLTPAQFAGVLADNIDEFELQKFAELIIEDIGKILSGLIVPETFEQDVGPYEYWNRALGTLATEIEQHFYGDAHTDDLYEK
jgi:hypothetical protein